MKLSTATNNQLRTNLIRLRRIEFWTPQDAKEYALILKEIRNREK